MHLHTCFNTCVHNDETRDAYDHSFKKFYIRTRKNGGCTGLYTNNNLNTRHIHQVPIANLFTHRGLLGLGVRGLDVSVCMVGM